MLHKTDHIIYKDFSKGSYKDTRITTKEDLDFFEVYVLMKKKEEIMTTNNVRRSNLELYRIIVMLLIVAHHDVVNSGLVDVMATYSQTWERTTLSGCLISVSSKKCSFSLFLSSKKCISCR